MTYKKRLSADGLQGTLFRVRNSAEPIEKVVLSFPSVINLAKEAEGARSWIQLARTGSFVSKRYGKFAITKEDLSQMATNFRDVTPKAPTELPIDYDHLSMDPKKPGDGVAAGWLKKVELRESGEELWGQVEWTDDAAESIEKKKYKFVSPSFIKDHTHKDGKKIGTTLLAAAITNHPFLEGMKALTLYSFSATGQTFEPIINLAEIGQRVMIAPGEAHTQDEVGGTFEVIEVVGEGDDAFVTVKDAAGNNHKWFRATDLLPASATPANPAQPALVTPPGAVPTPPIVDPAVAAAAAANPASPAAAALNPAAAAAVPAPAAPVVPGATPVVPGAVDPAAAAAEAAAKLAAGAEPATGSKAEADKEGEKAKATDGATGAEGEKKTDEGDKKPPFGEEPKKAVEKKDEKSDNDADLMVAIRRAVAAALAGQPAQKGIAMSKFMLRDEKGAEFEVTAEQLEKAGIKIVPEGAVAIPATELTDLKTSVTNLSSTVQTMQTDAKTKAKEAVTLELTSKLDELVKGALITKVTRDALFEQFKDSTDLTSFRALAKTFTTPVLNLNKEHGSGGDAPPASPEGASKEIIELAEKLQKEKGISLRDATLQAGIQLADKVEEYREAFAG